MNEILQKFKELGMSASSHYACDNSNEWSLGNIQVQRSVYLYDNNPSMQSEMRDIAEGFLWSLKSVRPVADYLQDDRKLSSGRIKTATGYVEEDPCTDLADFPKDLGNNKGW